MPKSGDEKLQSALSERTTLRTILTSIFVAGVGIALLVLSAYWQAGGQQTVWSNLSSTVGDLLIASVAVASLWELAGKRVFLDELLSKVRLSQEIVSSGITSVNHDFAHGIDWETYFSKAEKVDIFFAYAHAWRSDHHARLQLLAKRRGTRIRVVLPDPDDELILNDLGRRFGYSSTKVRDYILEAEQDFRSLRPTTGQRCASISLWYLQASPQISFYRFDRVAILAMYSHRHERTAVPTIICEQGGSLYEFIWQEFAAMINPEKGLARPVWEQNA